MEPQIISSGLYRITNTVNGKCYIGISKHSPKKRFAAHITASRKGSTTALHRAMRKYGEHCFQLEQLVICKPGQFLKELEVKAIEVYGTRAPFGYNLTAGGDGVVDGSPEVAEKIRISRALNPTVISKAGREIISETHKNLWANPIHRESRLKSVRAGMAAPGVEERRRASIKRSTNSPEGIAVKTEVSKRLWATQEYRDKVNAAALAGMRTPQAKINRSEAAKAGWLKRKQA